MGTILISIYGNFCFFSGLFYGRWIFKKKIKTKTMKKCNLEQGGYCIRGIHCLGDVCTKLQEECPHSDVTLVVLAVVANCETTALQCDYCGQLLTEPKTDC